MTLGIACKTEFTAVNEQFYDGRNTTKGMEEKAANVIQPV